MLTRKILIIGGSYFAGRALVEQLKNNRQVAVFTFNRGNIPLNIKGVTEFHGDRTDSESIRKTIPSMEWDALIDFCGYAPEDIESVIHGVSGKIKHYIFLSSTSVYDHSSMLPLNETTRTIDRPQPELGDYADYAFNKIKAEHLLEKMCGEKSIAYTILRPSTLYGRFNYAPRENYFFDLMEQDQSIIIPENDLALFTFIFVEDLAKIILRCIGNKAVCNMIFNVVSHEFLSYQRFIDILETIAGKKIKTIKMGVAKILRDRIPLPFPIDHHQVYSGEKLNQALCFEFTPLVCGMKKTYAFHQSLMEKKEGGQ